MSLLSKVFKPNGDVDPAPTKRAMTHSELWEWEKWRQEWKLIVLREGLEWNHLHEAQDTQWYKNAVQQYRHAVQNTSVSASVPFQSTYSAASASGAIHGLSSNAGEIAKAGGASIDAMVAAAISQQLPPLINQLMGMMKDLQEQVDDLWEEWREAQDE